MGFGSNILASDKGIPLIIVRYSSTAPLLRRQEDVITTDAATQLDDLAQYALDQGLDGLTAMSGIPGTVGGAITGNAGAYGQQICDHLASVTALMPDNTLATFPKASLRFGYRDSAFKDNGGIILSAAFSLKTAGDIHALRTRRQEILETRLKKHGSWTTTPCAGSFFRNVEPTSSAGQRQAAGWFLEKSGAKELNINGAHAYAHHANIITRDEGATAQDVYDLTVNMAAMVKKAFAIDLVREVRLLGAFDRAPASRAQGYW